jgi:hypothetical protein
MSPCLGAYLNSSSRGVGGLSLSNYGQWNAKMHTENVSLQDENYLDVKESFDTGSPSVYPSARTTTYQVHVATA